MTPAQTKMSQRLAFCRYRRQRSIAIAAALVTGVVAVGLLQQGRELARRIEVWSCAVTTATGRWPVGRTTIALEAEAAEQRRVSPLTADLWYPATAAGVGRTQQPLRCYGFAFWRKPDVQTSGPAAVAASAPLPMLIYLPGWGNRRDDNTFLLADLASHGFVVVALDDIAHDPPTTMGPGPAPLKPFDLGSEVGYASTIAEANRRIAPAAARVSQVLDRLAALNARPTGTPLDLRMDLARVAVFGFSFGGTTAAEALLRDPRLRAGANLDGGQLFGEVSRRTIEKLYLALNSDFPGSVEALQSQDVERRLIARMVSQDREILMRQGKRPHSAVLVVKGTQHTDFSDRLFATTLASVLKRSLRAQTELGQIRATTVRLLVQFFERALLDPAIDPAAEALGTNDTKVEFLR